MSIWEWLTEHNVPYERRDHEPVFTCDDVGRVLPDLPGARTKNLFICDGKGKRHFLVTYCARKKVDFKKLASLLGVSKVRMASASRLRNYLEIEPGAVSLLAVVNDRDGAVEVVIDRELWQAATFQLHPLVNSATLVMERGDLARFLELTNHSPRMFLLEDT